MSSGSVNWPRDDSWPPREPSPEIAQHQGGYDRTVAVVINSYVGPGPSRYLNELGDDPRERAHFPCR